MVVTTESRHGLFDFEGAGSVARQAIEVFVLNAQLTGHGCYDHTIAIAVVNVHASSAYVWDLYTFWLFRWS